MKKFTITVLQFNLTLTNLIFGDSMELPTMQLEANKVDLSFAWYMQVNYCSVTQNV